jgi:hypothetical protein
VPIVVVEVEVTSRLTAIQLVWLGVELTLGHATRYYSLSEGCCLKVAVLFLWGALSDERTGLQFAVQFSITEWLGSQPKRKSRCCVVLLRISKRVCLAKTSPASFPIPAFSHPVTVFMIAAV